ncbi:MAG: hypothetical protein RIS47_2100, partial [Bacteroidota bacterium]
MKSIAIIGTGGVGGYFGAKMAAAGYEVTFFARGTHLEALRRDGISVRSFLGDFSVPVVAATGVIDEMPAADLVLVCLKAWQVKGIIPELKRIMKPNTVVLPLQNGVTIAQELRAGLGAACVVPGLCRIISMIDSPGVISHIGVQPTIVFGEETGQTTDRVLAMKAVFDNSGFNSRLVGDIQADLWKKFISICVGGVLAVHSKTY